jgi:DNA invertase Pin-like site-specific DNA recombinase
MEHVAELAREHGTAELWAQHSDRLARGDGRSARHAVEIALWALKHDVRIRTVQDPDTFRDLLYAVVTGQRNHEDSRRRGLAANAGRRRAAARGDYLGYKPDGYRLAVDVSDDGATIRKRLVIDQARQPAIETVFRMGLRGRSPAAIAAAMNKSGWLTKPGKGLPPREWRPAVVVEILKNPRYAGLSTWKGEVLATDAWPAYVTERQHARLQAKFARENEGKRPVRRGTSLLSNLATCGRCAAALHACTERPRVDGSIPRRYVCSRHRWRYGSACEQMPIDADLLERVVVRALPRLLACGHTETNSINPPDLAEQRRRIVEAARADASDRLDAAIGELMALSTSTAHRRVDQAWAQSADGEYGPQRTAETRRVNQRLRSLLASLTIQSDAASLILTATRDSPLGTPGSTTVHVDLAAARQEHSIKRPRHQAWSDAAILDALRAWADERGRAPLWSDWRPSNAEYPEATTVKRRFGTWSNALHRAGLTLERPPGNRPWTDEQILACLRSWADTHGRPPTWEDWLKAEPSRPCLRTVTEHFGSWHRGLAAAGKSPPCLEMATSGGEVCPSESLERRALATAALVCGKVPECNQLLRSTCASGRERLESECD